MGKIVYMFGKDSENKKEPETKPEEPVYFDQISEIQSHDENAVLLRLGMDKESGVLQATWDEVAAMMNEMFREGTKPETESSWRKKYAKLRSELRVVLPEDEPEEEDEGDPNAYSNVIDFTPLRVLIRDMEKKRVQQRDERSAYARQIRSEARQDSVQEIFRETIRAFEPIEIPKAPKETKQLKAVYAMLSDIHYGLEFRSYVGDYNSDIARERVLRYADEIILAGRREGAKTCFVSLMGDMVSGVIHQTIRVENKENAIEQVVGVSELIAAFLYYLAQHFERVIVNSVDGNHSRLDSNLENTLRKERMDSLIPWYCKAKLSAVQNVVFEDNDFDTTVASFRIGDCLYVSVHGDMEKDLKTTANVLEKRMGQHIDYLLAGHMHVPEMRTEDTMYIRNGSVCGSGDDYTMKKRLFAPPCQVFMILNSNGTVDSIHTINLSNVSGSDTTAAAV